MYHIALEFIHISEVFLTHTLLTVRTGLPQSLTGLVTSYMDILRREKFNDFREHRLQKLKCLFLSGTEVSLLIWKSAASEFRICGKHFFAMAWHLYLRNHFNMPLMCIFYDFPDVILGIISSVRSCRTFLGIMSVCSPPVLPDLLGSPGGKFGQTRIGINLKPPSSPVSQVKMHTVHLERRHRINLLLKKFNASEMTGDIKVHSPVTEPRTVIYFTAQYFLDPAATCHLVKGLESIKDSGIPRSLYFDTVAGDLHRVCLRTGHRGAHDFDRRFFLKTISAACQCIFRRYRNYGLWSLRAEFGSRNDKQA